ncbi:hypothetical protein LTR85_006219 [Meristemomyces frigidus]|nr:hypothetical protein LTR85_006219 [Meristemomyces frigidus]
MEPAEYNVHGHLSLSPDKAQPPATALVDLTPGEPNQDCQVKAEHPQMQALWDNTVGKELAIPYKYRVAAVLIVRWADYLDRDLKCGAEVDDLTTLFTQQFKFECSVLTLDDKRSPQLQLRNGIDSLVLKYDGSCRSTLLIVYYTGHGVGRDDDGLDITGVREPGVSAIAPKFEARANWNEAEDSLHNAEADVLTILDCCCAGAVMKGSMEDIRTFEVLAATGRKSPTEPPGKRSFTRAMIAALQDQLGKPEQAPFTTLALNEEIMRRRSSHRSHLFRQPASSHRLIKIAPLQNDDHTVSPTSAQEASYLTVRFSFKDATTLKSDQVVRLAKEVSQSAANSELGINRIDWVDFQQNKYGDRWPDFVRLLRAVKHVQRRWRALVLIRTQKRKRGREDHDAGSPSKRLHSGTKGALAPPSDHADPLSPPQSVKSNYDSPA